MGSITRETTYFETGGPEHTDATLELSLAALKVDAVSCLVVASGGETLLRAAKLLRREGLDRVRLVGVTLQAGTWKTYGEPDWEKLDEARKLGAKVLTCTHALMGNVESAILSKFGGMAPVELIARTLYAFSQGTKVAVEIAMSAVDAGLVPAGEDLVSVAGTNGGADTALLIKAVSTVDFFDLRVKQVLCKPL